MATYNKETLQQYFDNRNYLGAADYLSTIKASSPQNQIILNRRINKLRRDGEIQKAMVDGMTLEEQNAYHFMQSLQGNGIIPHIQKDKKGNTIPNSDNNFGDKHIQSLNNLTTTDGTVLNTVGVSLKDDSFINNIYDTLGVKNRIQAKEKYNLSIETDASTGRTNIYTDRTNKQLPAILNAIQSSNMKDISYKSMYSPSIGGIITFRPSDAIEYYGLDSEGNKYGQNDINLTALSSITDNYNSAKRTLESAYERLGNKEYDEEMYVTPFLGQGQANAYKRLSRGLISMDDYNKIVAERTKIYNTLLKQADLTQQPEVYAVSADSDKNVLQKIDSDEVRKLNQILLYAMQQEDRVTYSAAMHGGEVGTYITIGPGKKDEKAGVDNQEKSYRIFVPNLFKSSCDEAFNADTKTQAARELADMKHWNYGKKLTNGEYVGYDKNLGSYKYVKDIDGNQVKYPITQEELLQNLDREAIINQSIDTILANLDNNGNPLNRVVNGVLQPYNIDESIKMLSAVGTNELYPKGMYSDGERLEAQNNLYNDIMEIISNVINQQNEK